MDSLNVAIVGASGLVGRTMLKVLEERNFPIKKLRLFGSNRSKGSVIHFKNENYSVETLEDDSFDGIDIALFSAGSDVSKIYAPKAAKAGAIAIDNSSCWRRDPNVPLVVPEVNKEAAFEHKGIIANPNCNVIPLVVAFKPLDENYVIKRVIVSTYQSISGAGNKGLTKLEDEINGIKNNDKHPIFSNAIFHPHEAGTDQTNEEIKLEFETRKIMGNENLKVAATCVRLPFFACHAEAAYLELEKSFEIEDIKHLLNSSQGIVINDDLANDDYPTPQNVAGFDQVFIGRIRRDTTVQNGLALWIVSDNIRKGAATNAVQIAELFIK